MYDRGVQVCWLLIFTFSANVVLTWFTKVISVHLSTLSCNRELRTSLQVDAGMKAHIDEVLRSIAPFLACWSEAYLLSHIEQEKEGQSRKNLSVAPTTDNIVNASLESVAKEVHSKDAGADNYSRQIA
ncbi:hypothetical protein PsorP6_007345 [Peronosclerospora sorghi]|uniref:Uncharacterized protein n=1 Tax=Peronosclerospora sorghi TaxID=230839 RepID=A0ACC0WBI6_9STRA|nr:hypothetical protein PsorP6_007345 [Peronosclerospora sorghi]